MKIVDDPGFHRLMKTGRPQYKIPSGRTVARDVHVVFRRVKERITKMLKVRIFFFLILLIIHLLWKEYDGRLSFATDAWTSPNQRAYVAITVHFEHKGEAVSMLLDIVEVAQSHSGENLASAFAKIMEDYEISEKVNINLYIILNILLILLTRFWGLRAITQVITIRWSRP
jgi:hypothetical protein